MPITPAHRRLRAAASASLLGAVLAAAIAAAPAAASPNQPYWPGNLVVHYNVQPLPPAGDSATHSSIPPISTVLQPGLDEIRSDLCSDVQSLIDSDHVHAWGGCSIGQGELWAAQLNTTQIALRYTVPGNQFSFSWYGSWHPTVDINADFQADAVIDIGGRSDGDSTSTTAPLSVGSVTASFSDATVANADQDNTGHGSVSQLVGADHLQSLTDSVDQNVNETSRFQGQVGVVDADLHGAARTVAAYEPEAGANDHFTFAARLDGYGNLIVNYGRGPLPGDCQRIDPPPGNYGLTVQCPNDGGHNTLWVSAGTSWQQVDTGTTQLFWDPAANSQATWNVCGTNTFGTRCGPFSTDLVLSTADENPSYTPTGAPPSQDPKCNHYCRQ